MGQNFPCAAAASDASAAIKAWGCASCNGKCRNTKRILFGKRSSNSFGVVAATLQLGHSKSPYSTMVTRACSEPNIWSVGSSGTARLGGEFGLMNRLLGSLALRGQFNGSDFHTNDTRSAQQVQLAFAPYPIGVEQALQAVYSVDRHRVECNHAVAGLDAGLRRRAARHHFQDMHCPVSG